MKLIAETAFHHEGDAKFMSSLVGSICSSSADIVKLHFLLDIDSYMMPDHSAYELIKKWMFSSEQWREWVSMIHSSGKELMALVNDVKAAEFAAGCSAGLVELHSVALNDKKLIDAVKANVDRNVKIVCGVGGSSLYEIENVANNFADNPVVLMFGFQNYPTRYQDINLRKIRRVMSAFPEFEYGYADHTAWNEPSNVMISLLGAAQGMEYVEKHVSHHYGIERTDYSAAVSFDMLTDIKKGMEILDACAGDGLLRLNSAERKYAALGLMKKVAVLNRDVEEGEELTWDVISFLRTSQSTDMSQMDVWQSIGQRFSASLSAGMALNSLHLKG
jgi:sialic acid synthase SpsE